MQEIIIIFVAVSLIDVWIYELVFPICYEKQKKGLPKYVKTIHKYFKKIFKRKPFDCEECIGFWVGLILSITMFNIIYLTLPLIIKFKNKL